MKGLFLALLLAFAGTALSAPVDPDFDAKYKAWTIVCEMQTDYPCEGVKPPTVRLVNAKDYRGYYTSSFEEVIFFSTFYYENFDEEPEIMKLITLVHESTHYLMKQHGVLRFESMKAMCASEAYAFGLTNDWLVSIGRDDLVLADWWKPRPGYRGYWKCFTWHSPWGGYVISEPSFGK